MSRTVDKTEVVESGRYIVQIWKYAKAIVIYVRLLLSEERRIVRQYFAMIVFA